ncbi:MAG: iron-containing redox enzyme family protein [Polyangiales bacterium]
MPNRTAQDTRLDHIPAPAEQIVTEYDQFEVAEHPFFADLRRGPVDMTAMWLLMANLQRGISEHFVRWLAAVISRVDNPRIASLLAKQLNDELGNGDFRQIHSVLLQRFVDGLATWKPAQADPLGRSVFDAGERLYQSMSELFRRDPYEGVGALMVSEIFAKKMDRCVGDEIRRQSALSRETLVWLDLHETLEMAHADDSLELAYLLPTDGVPLEAAWAGARKEWSALWSFLDTIQQTNAALRQGRAANNQSA